ncbi:MAG TPA: hypothetical protein PL188_11100 [Candidatus Cloacimonadota bacterium]|nr:hypothetical protein [Candidatus Cloacimonadota bacterium]
MKTSFFSMFIALMLLSGCAQISVYHKSNPKEKGIPGTEISQKKPIITHYYDWGLSNHDLSKISEYEKKYYEDTGLFSKVESVYYINGKFLSKEVLISILNKSMFSYALIKGIDSDVMVYLIESDIERLIQTDTLETLGSLRKKTEDISKGIAAWAYANEYLFNKPKGVDLEPYEAKREIIGIIDEMIDNELNSGDINVLIKAKLSGVPFAMLIHILRMATLGLIPLPTTFSTEYKILYFDAHNNLIGTDKLRYKFTGWQSMLFVPFVNSRESSEASSFKLTRSLGSHIVNKSAEYWSSVNQ